MPRYRLRLFQLRSPAAVHGKREAEDREVSDAFVAVVWQGKVAFECSLTTKRMRPPYASASFVNMYTLQKGMWAMKLLSR